MDPKDRRSLLERHLASSPNEARAALEKRSYDILTETARDLRARAWELREGERMFGSTRLSGHAIRRLEEQAARIDRNLDALLAASVTTREKLLRRREERHKRELHKEYMRQWRQRKKAEMAEQRARELAGKGPPDE